ncbi:MAG: NUDIX domain-containing protein [Cyanobacteria bacterium P01_F01_bin.150]
MSSLIQYCPACGQKSFNANSAKSFLCSQCDFLLYLNAAAAVAAIIESEGDILLAVRGENPGLGLLDLPGGFVDHQETVEDALIRELQEELGLDVGSRESLYPKYLGSFPNSYNYRGLTYETVDMFYHIVFDQKPDVKADDDVSALIWVPREQIPMDKIAFSSIRNILELYGRATPPQKR